MDARLTDIMTHVYHVESFLDVHRLASTTILPQMLEISKARLWEKRDKPII